MHPTARLVPTSPLGSRRPPRENRRRVELLVAVPILVHPRPLLGIREAENPLRRQRCRRSVDAAVHGDADVDRSVADVEIRFDRAVEPGQRPRDDGAAGLAAAPLDAAELVRVPSGRQAEAPDQRALGFVDEMRGKRSAAVDELPRIVMTGDPDG